jgi:hypothetical protein
VLLLVLSATVPERRIDSSPGRHPACHAASLIRLDSVVFGAGFCFVLAIGSGVIALNPGEGGTPGAIFWAALGVVFVGLGAVLLRQRH